MSAVPETASSDDVRNAMRQLRDLSELQTLSDDAKEKLRLSFRTLALRSLYFLTKAVLGYSNLTEKVHKPFADFIQNLENERTLDLMPRGTYKTTVGTIGFTVWYLLNHPDESILISNQTAGNAERMVLEIEGHFDGSNALMNWLFPEFIKPNARWKPWSSKAFTVPCRSVISGTPSVMAMGVGAKAESWHFHVIIKDDLIGEKAMMSLSVMLDAISWHDYSESLFVSPKHGIERMHGTRWSMSDLYSVVMQDPQYVIYERAARDKETGELLFPELLDEQTLRRIRDRNFQVYMSQYMNDPQNPEALDFRKDWLGDYLLFKDEDKGLYCQLDGENYYVKDMNVALFVDPAGSGDVDINIQKQLKRGRAARANNAVGIWGLHGSGHYFLLDLWTGRGVGENPELQVAKQMLKLFMRWKGYVRKGYVENYGAQQALITIFNMLCKEYNEAFQMEGIGRSMTKAKIVRIRGALGGPGQNRQINVRSIHDQFIQEFSTFPQSDTFDTLDMSTWAFIQLRMPDSPVRSRKEKAENQKRKRRMLRMVSNAGY